jgi:hypothetical protein
MHWQTYATFLRPALRDRSSQDCVWLGRENLHEHQWTRFRSGRAETCTGSRFPNWKRNVCVTGLREGGIPRTGQMQRIVFNEKSRKCVASQCCRI